MNIDFFGSAGKPLLGTYHPAKSPSEHNRAVLICPPIGQEYIRTHWAIRLFANQLSRRGIHAFRFDYRGHGDSWGKPNDVQSLSDWQEDIELAIDQLKHLSGNANVMLFGLRMGSGLAAGVAAKRDDVHSLVTWEPILDGQEYLEGLRNVHETMIDLWFTKKHTPKDKVIEELLGYRYRTEMLTELETWRASFGSLELPQLHFTLQHEAPSIDHQLQKVCSVDDKSDWCELESLETAWLRPRTTQRLITAIDDMFDRLDQFGILTSLQSNRREGVLV